MPVWTVPSGYGLRGFSTSGYTDTQFCMNKDGKLDGLDKKSGDCKGDKTLVSIPIKG